MSTITIDTTYECCGRKVKGWKNADTVIFLVWCEPEARETGRKKGEKRVEAFLKKNPEAIPAGEKGTAYNGGCEAYNGEWIFEYRLENPANLD